jgi:hypothetical protein
MNPPNFLKYLMLNNEEKGETLEFHLNDAGKLSLTSADDPDRSVVFDADADLVLHVSLQERRETIALHTEMHWMIETDLS